MAIERKDIERLLLIEEVLTSINPYIRITKVEKNSDVYDDDYGDITIGSSWQIDLFIVGIPILISINIEDDFDISKGNIEDIICNNIEEDIEYKERDLQSLKNMLRDI